MLTFAGRQQGVSLSGVVPVRMKDVSTIESKMRVGSLDALSAAGIWPSGKGRVVLGGKISIVNPQTAQALIEPLRLWFGALYEVLLGQSQGPRFGSFVAIFGIDRTVALIERALAGDLVAA